MVHKELFVLETRTISTGNISLPGWGFRKGSDGKFVFNFVYSRKDIYGVGEKKEKFAILITPIVSSTDLGGKRECRNVWKTCCQSVLKYIHKLFNADKVNHWFRKEYVYVFRYCV